MRSCRKYTRLFISMLILVCAVFLLHLIVTPLRYTKGLQSINNVSGSGNAANMQTPFHQIGESLKVIDFTGNQTLTDMEINYIINRNLREFESTLNRSFNALAILFASLCISMYYILSLIRKTIQHRSLLALSMGGHAPPMIFFSKIQ